MPSDRRSKKLDCGIRAKPLRPYQPRRRYPPEINTYVAAAMNLYENAVQTVVHRNPDKWSGKGRGNWPGRGKILKMIMLLSFGIDGPSKTFIRKVVAFEEMERNKGTLPETFSHELSLPTPHSVPSTSELSNTRFSHRVNSVTTNPNVAGFFRTLPVDSERYRIQFTVHNTPSGRVESITETQTFPLVCADTVMSKLFSIRIEGDSVDSLVIKTDSMWSFTAAANFVVKSEAEDVAEFEDSVHNEYEQETTKSTCDLSAMKQVFEMIESPVTELIVNFHLNDHSFFFNTTLATIYSYMAPIEYVSVELVFSEPAYKPQTSKQTPTPSSDAQRRTPTHRNLEQCEIPQDFCSATPTCPLTAAIQSIHSSPLDAPDHPDLQAEHTQYERGSPHAQSGNSSSGVSPSPPRYMECATTTSHAGIGAATTSPWPADQLPIDLPSQSRAPEYALPTESFQPGPLDAQPPSWRSTTIQHYLPPYPWSDIPNALTAYQGGGGNYTLHRVGTFTEPTKSATHEYAPPITYTFGQATPPYSDQANSPLFTTPTNHQPPQFERQLNVGGEPMSPFVASTLQATQYADNLEGSLVGTRPDPSVFTPEGTTPPRQLHDHNQLTAWPLTPHSPPTSTSPNATESASISTKPHAMQNSRHHDAYSNSVSAPNDISFQTYLPPAYPSHIPSQSSTQYPGWTNYSSANWNPDTPTAIGDDLNIHTSTTQERNTVWDSAT